MTETGRSSTSVLKAPLRPETVGWAFQTIPKHGPFSKRIRSIIIAPEGHEFIEVDKRQAEARVVAHLADDKEMMDLIDNHDIHRITASWLFGKDPKDISEDERFVGKTTRHAGAYGMGKRRMMLGTNADARKFGIDITISESEADRILTIFHKRSPKIRGVFHAEVRRCLRENNKTLINPFGRIRTFFGRPGEETDKEAFAQIPQSTVPDDLRLSGLAIDREAGDWLRICLEAHDAFLFKSPKERRDKAIKLIDKHFNNPIDFAKCSISRGILRIPIEIKVGKNYGQMEKINL